MIVRKTLRVLALALLTVGSAACGDKTVTTPPAASSAETSVLSPQGSTAADQQSVNQTDAADDARLDEVDQMLRDIEADLGAADQDAATPEGDPTR